MLSEDEFWSKVKIGEEQDCWEWQGYRGWYGYGRVWNGHRDVLAHRKAYELTYGDIPPDLNVLHRCDNPPCCNPHHLYLGTAKDNTRDKLDRGRPGGKLSADDVHLILAYVEAGAKREHIAQYFHVTHKTIDCIVEGRMWKNVTQVPWRD